MSDGVTLSTKSALRNPTNPMYEKAKKERRETRSNR
jgi:hypothetical protein